ncbi:signal peptidase II [Corynebacterium auriscanis]|uniref:signal peptidase II n=1 Tax=Corynebacterium auriscanis TaxID=99807 RepID=UPI0025B3D9EE|nr:signal peptidase II [Corynebacterium auriscanis]
MTSKRASLLAVSLMLAIIAIDQLSKWAVVENLAPRTAYPILGEWFRFYLVRNPGAAFSFGTDATIVFSFIQIAAVALCLFLAFRARSWWTILPIGLIGGGAAGNLIDRIFRHPAGLHGHVVDFFSFGSFAIFNVADSAITVGVVLYLIYTLFVEPRRQGVRA